MCIHLYHINSTQTKSNIFFWQIFKIKSTLNQKKNSLVFN